MVEDITNVEVLNQVYLIMTAVLYIISILGSILFVIIKGRRKLMPSFTLLRDRSKLFAYVSNIPMIIAFIIMIMITMLFVAVGG